MRLLPVFLLVVSLALAAPAFAQARDEAPEAVPAGPVPPAAEELTAKTTAQEKPAETKEEAEKPPAQKTAPKKDKPPAKEKKKQQAKKEPEAKKTAPVAAATADDKGSVIVINPCTGEVSEEAAVPPKIKAPRTDKSCLTQRQCAALCQVSGTFGSGGGSPWLTPDGEVVFSTDSFATANECIAACGPKCE